MLDIKHVHRRRFDPRNHPNFARHQYHEDADGAITIRVPNYTNRTFELLEALIRRGDNGRNITAILRGTAIGVLGTIGE